MKNYSRRDFLAKGTCGTMTSLSMFNALMQLKITGNAVAAPTAGATNDHKALVCVFLSGGNDSYNTLVPTTAGEYGNYAASRSNIALPAPEASGGVLPLNSLNTPGRTFGIHPAMTGIQSLFNDQKAAFIANVGTLVEPVPDVAAFRSGSFELPQSLFSHNSQQTEWQTSLPQNETGLTGWAGRMADCMNIANDPEGRVPMVISLSGNNILQTGREVSPYSIEATGAVNLNGAQSNGFIGARADVTSSLMEDTYKSILERAYANETRNSIGTFEAFSAAVNNASLNTPFPATSFGDDLQMISKSIAGAPALGHNRQIFFVEYRGWDDHTNLVLNHSARLGDLSNSINAFQTSMEDQGISDDVTLYTFSDFSRTLRSNGAGTDHAWGGNQLVVGGAVKGGKIYGEYPDNLLLGQGQDVGSNGRLLPTTSCDLYYAELAQWFGVSLSDLATILPNLSRFHTASATSAPLGFLL